MTDIIHTVAPVKSLLDDDNRRRWAGWLLFFTLYDRDRVFGFVIYTGRFSNIWGMAPTWSLGFSHWRTRDRPHIMNPAARIISV